MTAIVTMDEPRPRGSCMGVRVGGPPLDDGENYFRCDKCGGWFDARDLAGVEDHERVLRIRRAIGRSRVVSLLDRSAHHRVN